MPPWIISINFRSLAVLRLRSFSSSVSTGHFQPFMPIEEWRGEEAPLWRVFGAIVGLLVPNWAGFLVFTVGLTLALWGAGLAGICGCLPLVGHSLPATVGALGVIIGARISDTLVSHWGLYALGYRPNPGLKYATLRARSGFHCADILERPLACSGCGVDRHCGGRGCFRAGVAGDAAVQGDSALLGARALDSMAAAAGVDERVTSRLRGAYWALADTRRDAP
jgi:hypothetical protein